MARRHKDDEQLPRTIESAVKLVVTRMTEEMKDWLKGFVGDEAELRAALAARLVPGMIVRKLLGLWNSNPDLLAQLPPAYRHPDDAASYILIQCWHRLRSTQC
jgi:hypothetical protein